LEVFLLRPILAKKKGELRPKVEEEASPHCVTRTFELREMI